MSQIPNLGRLDELAFFFNGKRAGKDWRKVMSFNEKDNYYSGENPYLGRKNISHYKVYKDSEGDFGCDETNASDFDNVRIAYNNATLNGVQPDIVILRRTNNGDGTVSECKYTGVVMEFKRENKGFGDKVARSFSWTGIDESKAST